MSELKPCPFCGGEARYTNLGCCVYIRCDACDFSMPTQRTEAEAIEAWNTRHERTCIVLEEFGDDYVCNACGEVLRSGYDDPFEAIPLERFKYCFGCGAKVVGE